MTECELNKIIFKRYGEKPQRSQLKALASDFGLEISARQAADEMKSQILSHVQENFSLHGSQEESKTDSECSAVELVPSEVGRSMTIKELSTKFRVPKEYLEHKQKHNVTYRGYLIL